MKLLTTALAASALLALVACNGGGAADNAAENGTDANMAEENAAENGAAPAGNAADAGKPAADATAAGAEGAPAPAGDKPAADPTTEAGDAEAPVDKPQ